jgi:hypothetical protein
MPDQSPRETLLDALIAFVIVPLVVAVIFAVEVLSDLIDWLAMRLLTGRQFAWVLIALAVLSIAALFFAALN